MAVRPLPPPDHIYAYYWCEKIPGHPGWWVQDRDQPTNPPIPWDYLAQRKATP